MIYAIIQVIYITAFAVLFERMGFKWKWFLPLAIGFIVATFLTIPGISKGVFSSIVSADAESRINIITTPMFILFCPIHAFITVKVMKFLPEDSGFFEKKFVRALVYMGSAMIAGAIFAVIMVSAGMVYLTVTR